MNANLLLLCMAAGLSAGQDADLLFRAPQIEVKRDLSSSGGRFLPLNYLLYHRVYMGRNFLPPEDRADWGNPKLDYRRLPTTYFHDQSPIGVVLQKYNWFPTKTNEYHADARLPASIVGMGMQPFANLANLWSEPPVAVLGMDVGTLAAYARPSQVFHFTERVPVFVKLSLPGKNEERYFSFVQDALDRGASLKIFEGEPRDMIAKHGGEGFYQVIVIETYKLPVVDVHKELMTKEAIQMLLGKLRPGGLLCFHTSNRYYDLVQPLLNAAAELKCAAIVGRGGDLDQSRDEPSHRFTSEWVMIARSQADLTHLKEPPGSKLNFFGKQRPYWTRDVRPGKKILWTDLGENSFRGIYRSDPSIALLNDPLNDFEGWLQKRVGVPYDLTRRLTQPIHDGLYTWSVNSAEYLNRDLPKQKTDKPKKGDS